MSVSGMKRADLRKRSICCSILSPPLGTPEADGTRGAAAHPPRPGRRPRQRAARLERSAEKGGRRWPLPGARPLRLCLRKQPRPGGSHGRCPSRVPCVDEAPRAGKNQGASDGLANVHKPVRARPGKRRIRNSPGRATR